MIELIKEALKANNVNTYLISETISEKAELFFVKKNLDMRRAENTHTYCVNVYRDFEKDGNSFRGNAVFYVDASATAEELGDKIKRAYAAAEFVENDFYEIPGDYKSETVVMESPLTEISLEEAVGRYVDALYAGDTDDKAFINSSEFFVEKNYRHIVNSKGVDVSYVKYSAQGEYVVQCQEPQDVETYKDFSYDGLNLDELTAQVKETIVITKDRAVATEAPKSGEYDIVLSGKYAATVMSFYPERGSGNYIYMKYSDFEEGKFIQGDSIDDVKGDILDIDYIPTTPFSNEGIPMNKLSCIEKGVFKNIQSSSRYAHYLGVNATGFYDKIAVKPGEMSFEEMKKKKGLYIVNFSDFQMNPLTGYYAGEIRLAYLNDGEKITPVTGGSVNGSIIETQKDMILSKDTQDISTFSGPKAILLKGVSVAGA